MTRGTAVHAGERSQARPRVLGPPQGGEVHRHVLLPGERDEDSHAGVEVIYEMGQRPQGLG